MFFDLELIRNQSLLNKLTPVDVDALLMIKDKYPNIPDDYIDFMKNFGCGELGDEAYILYCGLTDPSKVYGSNSSIQDDFLLIGDDFSGYCSGFFLKDWSVVEIDPTNLEPIKIADSFSEFIRQKIEWAAK
jgi:hypothetical protein